MRTYSAMQRRAQPPPIHSTKCFRVGIPNQILASRSWKCYLSITSILSTSVVRRHHTHTLCAHL